MWIGWEEGEVARLRGRNLKLFVDFGKGVNRRGGWTINGSRPLKSQEGAEIPSTDRGNRKVTLSPENGGIEVRVEMEIDFVVGLEN